MKEENCPTNLLEDQPSDVDFLGGAHERLTDAIVQLIKNEKGGKTIGIEGSWGSGKSTVIKLLSKKLKNENIHICYFDAWAHEGDPLRRTFLEKLIDPLSKKVWIRPDFWSDKKLELQGKLVKTTVDAEPQITKFGKFLIPISLLSIPIGSALINKGADIGLSFEKNLEPNNYFIGGIISIFMPFLLMILAFYVKKCNNFTIKQINRWFELDKVTDIWSIFLQKYQQTITSHSSQKPNPTSVEFESTFIDLITEALEDNNHSIIIILDNLDRIISTDALSILSTLQTFLQCNGETSPLFERLWVVIPYDFNGIKKIWKTNSENDEKIAIPMIEKRIQIRFQVPSVILSNSKDYFITLMHQAFPTHSMLDYYQCYKIYYQSTIGNPDYPTPREIKSFINQIGSFHRQWNSQCEIPLSHITYYVLLLRTYHENKLIIEKIINEDIPTKEYKNFLSEKISEDLAVLIFNVEHNVATQLLFSKPLQESLINLDDNKIKKIYENSESGFWSILESLDNSYWSTLSPLNLAYATIGISNIFNKYKYSPGSKNVIFRSMQNAYMEINNWPDIDNYICQGICILLVESKSKKIANHIFNTINLVIAPSNTNLSKDEISQIEEKSRTLCTNRVSIIKCLHENYFSYDDFPGKIIIKSDIEKNNVLGIIEFLSSLSQIDASKEIQKLFITDLDKDNLLSVYNNLIDNGFFSYRYIQIKPILEDLIPNLDWSTSKYQIQQRIILHPETPNGALIEGLWIFDEYIVPIGKPEIENTKILSALLSNANSSFIEEDYLSITWIIIYYLIKGKTTEFFDGIEYAIDGYNKLCELFDSSDIQTKILPIIISKIKDYSLLDTWIEVSSSLSRTYELSKAILKSICLEEDLSQTIPGAFINESWEKISLIFKSAEFWDPLVIQLSKKIPLCNVIITTSFSSTKTTLYSSLIRGSVQPVHKFKKWIIQNLININAESWLEELQKEIYCINLVITLIENGEKEFLDIEFQDGVEKYVKKMLIGEAQPVVLSDKWNLLLDALKKNNRMVLRKNLFDAIKNIESINQNFFTYYGQEIIDSRTIIQDTEVFRKVFTGQFIEKENENGIHWLISLLERFPNILDEYPQKEDTGYFLEKLSKAARMETESTFKSLCVELCGRLGINLLNNEDNSS